MNKTATISFEVDTDLRNKFLELADREHRSANQILTGFVEDCVNSASSNHIKWLATEIEDSVNDPRPCRSYEEVLAKMDNTIEALNTLKK